MRLVLQFVVCFTTFAAFPPTVRAQDATASVAARALFNEGLQLAESNQWEDAADRFRRALALRPSAVIAYNLGTTLTHLGHPVEAAECFRRVARDAGADATLRANATEELASVEPAIAWVTIRVVGATDGLQLALDGQPVHEALLGSAVPVDPSEHAITLVDGHATAVVTQSVSLQPGERRELEIEAPPPLPLVVEPSPPPTLTLPPPEPPREDDTWLWVGVGSGAALVVVAGVIITVVLVSTPSGPMPWSGSAGIVEARP